MNSELAAMNKISRTVERAIADLTPDARDRVLRWFGEWLHAQRPGPAQPTLTPSASD